MKFSSLFGYALLPSLTLPLLAQAEAESPSNEKDIRLSLLRSNSPFYYKIATDAELEELTQENLKEKGVRSKTVTRKNVVEGVADTSETIEEFQEMLGALGIEEMDGERKKEFRGNIPEGAIEIPEGATEEEIRAIVEQAAAEAAAKAEAAQAEQPAEPEEPAGKFDPEAFSYYFGFMAAAELRGRSGVYGLGQEDFDFASYKQGFAAGLSGEEPDIETFDQERLTAAMVGFEQLVNERIVAMSEKMLSENAAREGVVTTESGLVYEVLEAGEGDPLGGMENKDARVLYEGKLPDGTMFDGNLASGQAVTFPLTEGALIPGFTEALKMMPVGAHYKLFIPAELAYGERAPQGIPANCALQFELIVQEAVDAPLPPLPGAQPPGGMPEGMQGISPEQIEELQRLLQEQGAAPLGE